MYKNFIKCLVVTPLIIGLSSCGDNVNTVKDGYTDFDITTTVGKALDNWQSCEKHSWKSFTNKNGVKTVTFDCKLKNVRSILLREMNNVSSKGYKDFASYLDVVSYNVAFAFTINQDGSVKLDNEIDTVVWGNSKSVSWNGTQAEQLLKSAYNDSIVFNPEHHVEYTDALMDADYLKYLRIEGTPPANTKSILIRKYQS